MLLSLSASAPLQGRSEKHLTIASRMLRRNGDRRLRHPSIPGRLEGPGAQHRGPDKTTRLARRNQGRRNLRRARRYVRLRHPPRRTPGTYYLMISARIGNQPFIWDHPVQLHSGANSLTLDQLSASPLN
jgi:hypothetical protein